MRAVNTLKNSFYSVTFQLFILIIGFFVPKIVISTYGSEVNGLTSNINQIINIINLLQAGLVGASIFEMFRPIAENDHKTVGSIFYSSKNYFNRVSWIFLALTLGIIPYILFVSSSDLQPVDVIFSVVILGVNAAVVFRYICCYDVIFTAHQKKYILIISSIIEKIIYYVLLFAFIGLRFHFVFMYVAALIANVVRIIYLEYKFRKEYLLRISPYKAQNGYKIKNQFKLFGNQVIQNIMEASPLIIVTSFYGLKYASVLSVYLIVTNIFKAIFSALQNAVSPSFGDLAASADLGKATNVFGMIQCFFSCVSIICYGTMSAVYSSFIDLYCEGIQGVDYVYNDLSVCMTSYISSYTAFLSFNMVINSFGLYGKVLRANIINGIISFVTMIALCAISFRLTYIGVTLYYLLSIVHRFVLLKNLDFKLNIKHIFCFVFPLMIVLSAFAMNGYMMSSTTDWISWIAHSFFLCLLFVVVALLYCFIFARNELNMIKDYISIILKRKRK